MKKLRFIVAFAPLLLAQFGFAQTNQPPIDKPFIEVTGTAEKEIIPDEIYISITLREQVEGKDKATVDEQEEKLKAALVTLGIPLDNLSLSDANSNYVKVRIAKKDVIAKSEYVLKVTDAMTLGKVFEKFDELKVTDARVSRVSHSKIEEYRNEVRIMAIKAAKDKADYLLQAINEETGKPIKVQELKTNAYSEERNSNLNIRGSRDDASFYSIDGVNKMTIQFEKIKLQAAIYVMFEIK